MTEPVRFLRASVVAPLPAIGLIAGVCLVGFFTAAPSSPLDDAPIRTAGALFMLSPAIYLLAVVGLYVSARALAVLGLLSLRVLVAAACIVSVALSLLFGLGDQFGLRNALITAGVFGGISLAFLIPTALLWWRLAHNKPLHPNPGSGASRLPSVG